MSRNSLYNEKTISNVKKVHKGFLWAATGVMIASLVLGMILIFVNTETDVFGKVQGTFLILAVASFISVNNLIRIEKGGKVIQGFATVGFFANIVWLILGIMMTWGVLSPIQVGTSARRGDEAIALTLNNSDYDDDYDDGFDAYDIYDDDDSYDYDYDYEEVDDEDYYFEMYDDFDYLNRSVERDKSYSSSYSTPPYSISAAARIMVIVASIASIGFWVSNILAIKDKVKAVIPLKITAIVCQVYCSMFMIVLALAWPVNFGMDWIKWVELSGLAASGFVITALAAWIIARTHREVDLATVKEEHGVDGAAPAEKKPLEVKEPQMVEEVQVVEGSQVVDDSQAVGKSQAVEESQIAEEPKNVNEP